MNSKVFYAGIFSILLGCDASGIGGSSANSISTTTFDNSTGDQKCEETCILVINSLEELYSVTIICNGEEVTSPVYYTAEDAPQSCKPLIED